MSQQKLQIKIAMLLLKFFSMKFDSTRNWILVYKLYTDQVTQYIRSLANFNYGKTLKKIFN